MEQTSKVVTAEAVQYHGSFCEHVGHKIPGERAGATGRIIFPIRQCAFEAGATGLKLTARAATEPDPARTAGVVTNYLERFTYREAPENDWTAVSGRAPPTTVRWDISNFPAMSPTGN